MPKSLKDAEGLIVEEIYGLTQSRSHKEDLSSSPMKHEHRVSWSICLYLWHLWLLPHLIDFIFISLFLRTLLLDLLWGFFYQKSGVIQEGQLCTTQKSSECENNSCCCSKKMVTIHVVRKQASAIFGIQYVLLANGL